MQMAAVHLEAAKNTGAILLKACEDKAQILAAIAECCCEQKSLTISEANATRALVSSVQLDDLRAKLVIAQQEIALANALKK